MGDSATLTIRGLHTDDTDHLFALWNTPEIILNSVELPYLAEDAFRERIITPHASGHTLIAEAGLSSGRKRIVGLVWLDVVQKERRRHTGQLSLVVHPDYYGTDVETALLEGALELAGRWLGLRRVEVILQAGHQTALALYQRYGFEVEATMRRYVLRDGVFSDAWLLARLRAQGPDVAGRGERE